MALGVTATTAIVLSTQGTNSIDINREVDWDLVRTGAEAAMVNLSKPRLDLRRAVILAQLKSVPGNFVLRAERLSSLSLCPVNI